MTDRTRTPGAGPDDLVGLAELPWTDIATRCSELVADSDALCRLVARWSVLAADLASEVEHLLGGRGLSDESFAAVTALLGVPTLFTASEDLAQACLLETAP